MSSNPAPPHPGRMTRQSAGSAVSSTVASRSRVPTVVSGAGAVRTSGNGGRIVAGGMVQQSKRGKEINGKESGDIGPGKAVQIPQSVDFTNAIVNEDNPTTSTRSHANHVATNTTTTFSQSQPRLNPFKFHSHLQSDTIPEPQNETPCPTTSAVKRKRHHPHNRTSGRNRQIANKQGKGEVGDYAGKGVERIGEGDSDSDSGEGEVDGDDDDESGNGSDGEDEEDGANGRSSAGTTTTNEDVAQQIEKSAALGLEAAGAGLKNPDIQMEKCHREDIEQLPAAGVTDSAQGHADEQIPFQASSPLGMLSIPQPYMTAMEVDQTLRQAGFVGVKGVRALIQRAEQIGGLDADSLQRIRSAVIRLEKSPSENAYQQLENLLTRILSKQAETALLQTSASALIALPLLRLNAPRTLSWEGRNLINVFGQTLAAIKAQIYHLSLGLASSAIDRMSAQESLIRLAWQTTPTLKNFYDQVVPTSSIAIREQVSRREQGDIGSFSANLVRLLDAVTEINRMWNSLVQSLGTDDASAVDLQRTMLAMAGEGRKLCTLFDDLTNLANQHSIGNDLKQAAPLAA